ncbi:MAG: phosphopentomutase [Bacillota bacterium]|nr:phosphopentomutase [Bacillota bacterium]
MGKKAVLIVLDSVGVGELPDAALFGDGGSDTLGNIFKVRGDVDIPNMIALGLGNIDGIRIPLKSAAPIGCFGKSAETFCGKDSTGGHWEIAGIVHKCEFPTYPDGFPPDIIRKIEKASGRKVIGNKPASGTEIIQELGDEQVETGALIVYTSADSVLQIAAHENVVPLDELYDICRKARRIMHGRNAVGRIIARPFEGTSGNYQRTENRRDFSLSPPQETILDEIKRAGLEVAAVGKIEDLFNFRGITRSIHSHGNEECVETVISFMKEDFSGLIFANLVDFDMLYGHRNDVEGFAKALEYFDARLPGIYSCMGKEDILILTADHGCDPTTKSTDHSREYTPLLVFGDGIRRGVDLGVRSTFADIGATIIEFLGLKKWENGRSFWPDIRK